MKKVSFKRVIANLLLILIAMIIIPTISKATDNEIAIVKVDEDYIVYINGLEEEPFKFAYTNDDRVTKTTALEELDFIENWIDTNNTNIACLEATDELDFTMPIYMWIETEQELFSVELNLDGVITKEEMTNVEALTTLISVDTTATTTTVEDVDGVTTTTTKGQIKIIDDSNYSYRYQLIKIDGTETQIVKDLMNLVETIKNEYSSMSMYNKILVDTKVRNLNKSLITEANYTDVNNMTILQPEESKEGDEYIVLLQKLEGNKVVANDIQILTCTEGYQSTLAKETNVVKVTTALPVTNDSIILFVVLVAIIVIAIVVIIKMKKLKKDEK